MNWKIIAATLVLGGCLGINSYASEHIVSSSFGADCGCEQDTCGCEPTCCKTKCCKMKYYKKVCRTRTKRVRDCCGCKKKVCVTKVSYRRVLCPKRHCASDLICACKKPCGYETCTPCEPACGCEAAPSCGCDAAPSCGCE